jgi:hypothetical protein
MATSATLVEENTLVKSLERQLQEKDQELRDLRNKGGNTGGQKKSRQLISESGLPEPSQVRLRKRFQESENPDVVKRAIAEEQAFVRKVRAGAGGQNQSDQARMVESFKLMGLSEKEAGIAAGVEVAVKDISESRQSLANAAKALGMSDAEAKLFSQI